MHGSVSFEVATNVFGTTVKGRSGSLSGYSHLRGGGEALQLEQIEVKVPVATLQTGIKVRDQHMRQYVFETADHQTPDLSFTAANASCVRETKDAYTCTAAGVLSLRGTPRPFTIVLDVKREDSAFTVKGAGKVALSHYGIERPSQFGVRTEDEVVLRLDLSARQVSASARLR
jgi:polyisoprenoid-binding protein YceI